jgi:hypothetical protein
LILDGLYIFAFFNAIVVDGKFLSQRLALRTNLSENTKPAKNPYVSEFTLDFSLLAFLSGASSVAIKY